MGVVFGRIRLAGLAAMLAPMLSLANGTAPTEAPRPATVAAPAAGSAEQTAATQAPPSLPMVGMPYMVPVMWHAQAYPAGPWLSPAPVAWQWPMFVVVWIPVQPESPAPPAAEGGAAAVAADPAPAATAQLPGGDALAPVAAATPAESTPTAGQSVPAAAASPALPASPAATAATAAEPQPDAPTRALAEARSGAQAQAAPVVWPVPVVDYGPVAPTPVVDLIALEKRTAVAVKKPASETLRKRARAAAGPAAAAQPAQAPAAPAKRRLCWTNGVVAPCR